MSNSKTKLIIIKPVEGLDFIAFAIAIQLCKVTIFYSNKLVKVLKHFMWKQLNVLKKTDELLKIHIIQWYKNIIIEQNIIMTWSLSLIWI